MSRKWFNRSEKIGRYYCNSCGRRVRGRGRWVWTGKARGWKKAIRRRCPCGWRWAVRCDTEVSIAATWIATVGASEGTAGT